MVELQLMGGGKGWKESIADDKRLGEDEYAVGTARRFPIGGVRVACVP